MISRVWILFAQELKIIVKDRQALGLLVMMPLALIVFLTLAMKDVYHSKIGRAVDLSVVSVGECSGKENICAELVTEIRRFYKDIEIARPNDSRRKTELELVLPLDIDQTIEKLKKGEKLEESEQIQLVFDPSLDQSMRSVVQGQVLLSLQTVLINKVQEELKKMEDAPPAAELVPNVSRFEGLISERAAGGMILPNPIQQTVPAWSLFGMFFIVIPLSNSIIRDRNHGIFRRLLSFPVTRGELLLGKVFPFLLINFIQFCLMFLVGVFLLPPVMGIQIGLDFNLSHLVIVTLVCSMAATSYGLMVACLARTSEQASAFGALSVVILAVIGGVMIPRFVMPEFMQTGAMVSPFYWGLEAYHDVILRKVSFDVASSKLAVLSAFSFICGSIALFRFRWSEV